MILTYAWKELLLNRRLGNGIPFSPSRSSFRSGTPQRGAPRAAPILVCLSACLSVSGKERNEAKLSMSEAKPS